MIKCEKCGNTVIENTRFCPKCGCKLIDTNAACVDSPGLDSSGLSKGEEKDSGIKKPYEERFVPNTGIDITRPPLGKIDTENTEKSSGWKRLLLILFIILVGIISYSAGSSYTPSDEEEAYAAAELHYAKHDFQDTFFIEHYETYTFDYRKENVRKILEGSRDVYMVAFPLVPKGEDTVIFNLLYVRHDKQNKIWDVTDCIVDRFGIDNYIY